MRITKSYIQHLLAAPETVFPLLCPVREVDWLDGWDYRMIYSESGLIEQNCIFTTQHHAERETTWVVTDYDASGYSVAFTRVTPGQEVVNIKIALKSEELNHTLAHISYQYTALNENHYKHLESQLDQDFIKSMLWWEKALNHYLEFGTKLLR